MPDEVPVTAPAVPEIVRKHALTDRVAEEMLKVARETKTCKIIIDPRKLTNNVMVKFGLHPGTPHFSSLEEAEAFCRQLGAEKIEKYNADILRGRQKILGMLTERYFENFIPHAPVSVSAQARAERRREYIKEVLGRA